MDSTVKRSVLMGHGTGTSALQVPVSSVSHYRDNSEPRVVSLLDWLETDLFKDKILALRSLPTKEQMNREKALLPVITPSGQFGNRIAEAELVTHSGFLAFDIDLKENTHIVNYDKLKHEISNIRNVAYCGLSASGTGYWGLVKIAYTEKHKQHFDALYKGFKSLGIVIDRAPRNVASKRGCSYDNEAYFNHTPTIFSDLYEEPLRITSEIGKKVYDPNSEKRKVSGNNKSKFKRYIDEIIEKEVDITPTYESWFQIGCALANEFGEEGREYFHIISQFHSKYNEKVSDNLFSKCLENPYRFTIGTFYFHCKQEGINPYREE